ncbi:YphA family membrane protein [Fictibacillus phosphorivorans]|uniref:YphA family membrane protein n=1 Tax=Fictibacillus phosphorivorans TaxID=1221500 RepID=UPI00203B1C7E|nr:hypothetical protein [Fictibacillus phosphorivorans]MCM3718948.1 hypothetical protein [Fictibacillus phosphorivorans]MCM3776570.1 hypothetical protein [Fictibacillus phosphorivorans]
MNDGILFYWFMWMGWVLATFLFQKKQSRNVIAFILLTGIILADYNISFSLGTVNAAIAFLFLIGIVHVIRNTSELLYYLTVSFIIAVSYVFLQIFALYDPAKLFIDKKYLLILTLAAVTFLITKRNKDYFYLLLIGLFIGDLLYQLMIFRLTGNLEIGSMSVLDLLASSTMIQFCMVLLIDVFKKLKRVSYKKVNPAKPF